jgi:hypothetical protein
MTCLHPIGKKGMPKSKSILPCRKCVDYLTSKSLQFGSICYHESTLYPYNKCYAYTLTYADDKLAYIDDFGNSSIGALRGVKPYFYNRPNSFIRYFAEE